MSDQVEAYDEIYFARLALSGITSLLTGNGNAVDPEEMAALLEPIELRLRKACEAMKAVSHV